MCSVVSTCVHFAFTYLWLVERAVTMTTQAHNPQCQRTSSGFECTKCSEVRYVNKLHLDGVGIQVTKGSSVSIRSAVQHDMDSDLIVWFFISV